MCRLSWSETGFPSRRFRSSSVVGPSSPSLPPGPTAGPRGASPLHPALLSYSPHAVGGPQGAPRLWQGVGGSGEGVGRLLAHDPEARTGRLGKLWRPLGAKPRACSRCRVGWAWQQRAYCACAEGLLGRDFLFTCLRFIHASHLCLGASPSVLPTMRGR